MHEKTQQLESILFLAGEPVAFSDLSSTLQITTEEIQPLLRELKTGLEGHGLSLVTTDTHAQLTTGLAVASFVAQFIHTQLTELSAAAAETLAIIAYRGPISRYDIDAIRGVDSRRILRQLVYRGLISREISVKNTAYYSITADFLQHLGLESRQQLPDFATLSSTEQLAATIQRH